MGGNSPETLGVSEMNGQKRRFARKTKISNSLDYTATRYRPRRIIINFFDNTRRRAAFVITISHCSTFVKI